jgi:hypothetical protein
MYSNTEGYCIYVPRMSKTTTEEMVRREMYNDVGRVSRVDFIPIGFKPGFDEFHDPLFKSAFIHFDNLFPNEFSNEILRLLNSGDQYKYMADCSQEYWYMWKANKPVQETILNKHQIMECGRWLQRQTEKQARLQLAQIEQMTKLIERQSRKIDEQEKRMEELEETIKNMLTFGDCTNVFDAKFSPIYLKSDDYDESYSVVSQRTNEADIDIQEYSDEDSREERMKISAELCGNN